MIMCVKLSISMIGKPPKRQRRGEAMSPLETPTLKAKPQETELQNSGSRVSPTSNTLLNQESARKNSICQRVTSRTSLDHKSLREKSEQIGLPSTRACSLNHLLCIPRLLLNMVVFREVEEEK
jgi:hypothetical protein